MLVSGYYIGLRDILICIRPQTPASTYYYNEGLIKKRIFVTNNKFRGSAAHTWVKMRGIRGDTRYSVLMGTTAPDDD